MTDTRAETKLLPCPFCGSEAVLSVSRDGDVCNVRCSEWSPGKCLGAGPNTYSEGKAIEAWNTRAPILSTEAAPSEPLDDKLVYIKPLRTLVRVQTMYADQVRDLCNAPAAPSEPVGFLIWWTNQADCERIVPLDTWPAYLYDEYQSRLGRPGRGRLWCSEKLSDAPLETVPWDEDNNWLCKAASDAGGIIIKAKHLGEVQPLPGFVTTFDMTLPDAHPPAQPAQTPQVSGVEGRVTGYQPTATAIKPSLPTTGSGVRPPLMPNDGRGKISLRVGTPDEIANYKAAFASMRSLSGQAAMMPMMESVGNNADTIQKLLEDFSPGELFNALLSRINFDGMDPRTFSLAELQGAIEGAKWPDTTKSGSEG